MIGKETVGWVIDSVPIDNTSEEEEFIAKVEEYQVHQQLKTIPFKGGGFDTYLEDASNCESKDDGLWLVPIGISYRSQNMTVIRCEKMWLVVGCERVQLGVDARKALHSLLYCCERWIKSGLFGSVHYECDSRKCDCNWLRIPLNHQNEIRSFVSCKSRCERQCGIYDQLGISKASCDSQKVVIASLELLDANGLMCVMLLDAKVAWDPIHVRGNLGSSSDAFSTFQDITSWEHVLFHFPRQDFTSFYYYFY